jgi:3-methyladenine DNA glycosylase AlkD
MWDRRAAMLVQRGLKGKDFDALLFYDCIFPSVRDVALGKAFFIAKGMGWALRQRAYEAPDEVEAFCREHGDRLCALTLREALKVVRARTGSLPTTV